MLTANKNSAAKAKKERARKPKPAKEEEVIPRAEPVNGEEQIAQEPMPSLPGTALAHASSG